jgi:hypothetical protein
VVFPTTKCDAGRSINPYEARVEAVVDAAVQRVCMQLLTGSAGNSPMDPEATAIQVAAVAYLRNLVSAPRDMSMGAAVQLRAACDEFLQCAYEFPEPAVVAAFKNASLKREAAEREEGRD